MARFSVFDTALGACGLAWREGDEGGTAAVTPAITHVELPAFEGEGRDGVRVRLVKRLDAAGQGSSREGRGPRSLARLQEDVRRHLKGEAQSFDYATIDTGRAPAFHGRAYQALRAVPAGSTVSYAELARLAGSPGASRAVGQAMAKNPTPLLVPCHRVLAAGGAAGGFSAAGGLAVKAHLLKLEGFPWDPEGHLSRGDRALGKLIKKVGPCALEISPVRDTFGALVRSIVYQQLTGKAAATILGRVVALFDGPAPTPRDILGARETALRGAGLSGSKIAALKDLAAKAESGRLPSLKELRSMSDETIVERLTEIRGIGRWSVEMLLMFRLGRADVLPAGDYGVRKGFQITYGLPDLPSEKDLLAWGERWRPHRSMASWYMWRAVDLARQEAP